MWLLWLIACTPDKVDDGFDADTGLLGVDDTSVVDDQGLWSPLEETAAWVSNVDGYGTGGGFADIDGDGDPDLVVAHGNDMVPGHIVVYENEGGILNPEPVWRNRDPAYYGHLSLGDVNNDGWIDLVVSRFLGEDRFDSPGGVELYLNQGGVLEDVPFWEVSGFFTFSVSLGDMDKDGWLDLGVAVGESYENGPDNARVFANDGTGAFGASPVWVAPEPSYSFDVIWADFDGDDWLDLALAQQQSGHIVYRNESGMLSDVPHWQASEEDGPYEGNTLDVGDVNQDGHLDLVVSDNDQQGGVGMVRLWCGPGLELCWSATQSYASAVSLHDWDGDGDLDLAYGGWWSPVQIAVNEDGLLSAEPGWTSTKDDIVVEALCWADVDGLPGEELLVTDWTADAGNRLWGR